MSLIHVLPAHVQNQIAAGEVVERPASVVKELVENALDAGALRVDVELEEGGRRLIRVADNGGGMDAVDLAACVERHATSKIRETADIFGIATMGFRGEALPSIASVSRLEIVSALPGAPAGHALAVEGGRAGRTAPCAARPGTLATVRDLFFNVPARRQFLRAAAAETKAAADVVLRLALAHPAVAFRFVAGGRVFHDLPPRPSLAGRLADLYSPAFVERLLAVDSDADGVGVHGFAALPPQSRPNSSEIFFFLNRRWIRHPGMARVVADAYRGRLPPRRYPFAVLALAVDPARIDVNVHPAKEEVRFGDERQVVGAVRRAIDAALRFSDLGSPAPAAVAAPTPTGGDIPPAPPPPAPSTPPSTPPSAPPSARAASLPEQPPSWLASSLSRPGAAAVSASPPFAAARRTPGDSPKPPAAMAPGPAAPESTQPPPPPSPPPKAAPRASAALAGHDRSKHRIIGQAGTKYLAVEGPDGLLLVDPHALHERWNYERLRGRAGELRRTRLLLPVVVEFPPAQQAMAEAALEPLREAGFDAELFGGGALSVSAAPDFLNPSDIEKLVRDAVLESGRVGREVERRRDGLLASLACRSAVSFGQRLPDGEIEAVLDLLAALGQAPTCPHGRPAVVRLSWAELARRFGR